MKKNLLFILFFFSFIHLAECQEISDFQELRFVGYKHSNPIFKTQDGYLYEMSEPSMKLTFLDSGRLDFFPKKYVGVTELQDDKRRYVETFKTPFKVIVTVPNATYIHKLDLNAEGITTDFSNMMVYFGNQLDEADFHQSRSMYQLNIKNGQIKVLPIKGINPVVIGDYLFYADYPDPKQFDLVYDIYRVKIGQWDTSERIFQDNFLNNWKVSPDGKYFLGEFIESGYKPRKVIYNIVDKHYAQLKNKNLPRGIFYSKKEKAFCFYDIGLNGNGRRQVGYEDIPKEFPVTPSWAMDFGNTFITNYLLDKASEDELNKLDKEQLYLLRNAIFARRGWQFKNDDLQKFFKQFSWYNEKIKGVGSNKDIKLTTSDKYRSQLILKIEKSK